MSAIKDGGPAFPVPMLPGEIWSHELYGSPNGMSLRDWFATHASEEDIEYMRDTAAVPVPESDVGDGFGPDFTYPTRQEARYLHADAMLAARERKEAE